MTETDVHYTIYKHRRNREGKWAYYAHFYDPETGKRLPARSTYRTSAKDARTWCRARIAAGDYHPKNQMTFREFTDGWWLYDSCSYVQKKLARGFSMSRSYVENRRSELENHIWSEFGDKRLGWISTGEIEDFMMGLRTKKGRYKRPLSEKRINDIVGNLKTILSEAYRLGITEKNPGENVGSLAVRPRAKQILSKDEAELLFDEATIDTVWKGDVTMYALNLLAASTAMRLGECVALHTEDIDFENGIIDVHQSWARKHGLKEPKWNSKRLVPIPSKTLRYLQMVVEYSNHPDIPDALIFANQSDPHVPIDHKTVAEKLYGAFDAIGIPEQERRLRNVTFHSWRHFFNTMMRTRVPDELLRSVTGHRSAEMTDHYTHFQIDDFGRVRELQETLI
jgi:integrase